MRTAHCTVALAVLAWQAVAGQNPAPAPAPAAEFTVFLGGVAVGVEEVTVERTPAAVVVSGTERLGAPLNVTINTAAIRYAPDMRPLECLLEGSIRNQPFQLHTTVAATTATTSTTDGARAATRSDPIAADALFLPNVFFGAYEALAARLSSAKAGDELTAFVPLLAQMRIQVLGTTDDRIRTPSGVVEVRRVSLRFMHKDKPADVELWADSTGRLARLAIPAQTFDLVRSDIAAVTARRESVSRPNDEQVRIRANGFSLAGTVSKPASKAGPAQQLPAVVLVGGSGPADRDETVAGVHLFGDIASALADGGDIVIRYDRRGVGQSGGRSESATLSDYAEDAVAALKYLRDRDDVDRRRIALLGYGEGGTVALVAAASEKNVAAVVLVGTPGEDGAAFTLNQQKHVLSLLSLPDAEKRSRMEMQEKLVKAVKTGEGLDAVPAALRNQADTPWFRSFLAFDPADVMKKVRQPILIVQGERDRQVDPSNADRLEALAKARKGAAGEAVTVLKVPGVNHLLVPARTGEVSEYNQLVDRAVSRDALSGIDGWLKSRMKDR